MEKRETFAQALCDVLVKQRVVSEAEGRALARAFKSSEKENFDDFFLSTIYFAKSSNNVFI